MQVPGFLEDVFRSVTGRAYQYTFVNATDKLAKVLLEEDLEGIMQQAIAEVSDGIPVLGRAAERRRVQIAAAYERLRAGARPPQELTLIPDQVKVVSARTPVLRCSAAFQDFRGVLKIFMLRVPVAAGGPLQILEGHFRDPTARAAKADTLEEAVMLFGGGALPSGRSATGQAGARGGDAGAGDAAAGTAAFWAAVGERRPDKRSTLSPRKPASPLADTLRGSGAASPGPRPKSTASLASVFPGAPAEIVPISGAVMVYSTEAQCWCPGSLLGLAVATGALPAGSVLVDYELPCFPGRAQAAIEPRFFGSRLSYAGFPGRA